MKNRDDAAAAATDATREQILRSIARIRAFEMRLLELFSDGKLFGTTHTSVGQEACAAGLYTQIDPRRDAIFTNHRCHGHYLAYGGSMESLMAEIMGKQGATCLGRGGSQHLCSGRFFSQGVQGGSMPIAAGYAARVKECGEGGIVVAHIGDGTLGEGVVYETANIVSLRGLPLLVVLENNGVAQSTDTKTTTAGDIETRFAAFGIDVDRRSDADPVGLADHFAEVVERVRAGRPFVQVVDTFRLMAHSKGDDDRDRAAIDEAWRNDYFARLLDSGDPEASAAWTAAEREVDELTAKLDAAEWEPLGSATAYRAPEQPLFRDSSELVLADGDAAGGRRVNDLLNGGLHELMAADPDVMVLGEDLLDPYGGAFKVTKGLSTAYPDRVFSTPISEAAIVGFGNGWSLAGGKAVVEIMFGDFAALAVDQIVNQAAKMHFMYGGKVCVPVTVRLVSGGYRGYGPTHSQSLESLFCGVPGLEVVALSRRHDPRALLGAAVGRDPNPVLFVENKLIYSMRVHTGAPAGFRFVPGRAPSGSVYPSLRFTTTEPGAAADVTVVTYGGMTDMVEEAMEQLILDEELEFDYFVLSQLSPLSVDDVVASVTVTKRLVTVEEGPRRYGVGTEVVSRVAEALPGQSIRVALVGAEDLPIPNSRVQETDVLPSRERIVGAIRRVWS